MMVASILPKDGFSHVVGDQSEPLLTLTIPALLTQTASRFPDHEAAVFSSQNERLTYQQLAQRVDQLAAGLLAIGLVKGQRIGIWSPNRLEWLLIQFASARIGLILVNINPAYRLSELEYALKQSGCTALILAESFKTSNYMAMIQELAPELSNSEKGQLKANRLPDLRHVIALTNTPPTGIWAFNQILTFADQIQLSKLDEITKTLNPTDPINIQYTSGTTGSPKGATLTHHNIVNNAHFVTRALNLSSEDRLCIPVPFYHCFGMVMGTLGCVTKGATMIIPGEGFDPSQCLKIVAEEKATALYAVPTMFVAILEDSNFSIFDLSNLRTGIMAGAPCPIEIMKRVIGEMHMHEVTIAYGMTETSPVSFQSAENDPIERRVGTVGRIHPHVEVKIVDEAGEIVPINTQGEIWTRGYSVMQGYWQDSERTKDVVTLDGWMKTGDLGEIDQEGYCKITGRLKDMIIRGGENIYPREIEEFLYTHPAISQVQVFGVPDKQFGEEVAAWIVLNPDKTCTEDTIIDFCKGKIAHYKIPRYIRFVDELPMTVTGKPQKFIMREQMINEMAN